MAFVQKANRIGQKCGANVIANASNAQLKSLYQTAKIFWHAKGMDVDEHLHPDLTEHFGMTTVEAMAGGCVPVVINKGGPANSQLRRSTWDTGAMAMKPADVSSLRMLRRARDRIDRDYADPIDIPAAPVPGCFVLMWRTGLPRTRALSRRTHHFLRSEGPRPARTVTP